METQNTREAIKDIISKAMDEVCDLPTIKGTNGDRVANETVNQLMNLYLEVMFHLI